MFVLMLMSMLMSHASVDIFVLFYLELIVMSINLSLKGLMFLRTLVRFILETDDPPRWIIRLTNHSSKCKPGRSKRHIKELYTLFK